MRSAIVGYIEDGDDIILLATNGMDEPPPAWWLNLQATPDAIVDLPMDRGMSAHARPAVTNAIGCGTCGSVSARGLDEEAAALQRHIPVDGAGTARRSPERRLREAMATIGTDGQDGQDRDRGQRPCAGPRRWRTPRR